MGPINFQNGLQNSFDLKDSLAPKLQSREKTDPSASKLKNSFKFEEMLLTKVPSMQQQLMKTFQQGQDQFLIENIEVPFTRENIDDVLNSYVSRVSLSRIPLVEKNCGLTIKFLVVKCENNVAIACYVPKHLHIKQSQPTKIKHPSNYLEAVGEKFENISVTLNPERVIKAVVEGATGDVMPFAPNEKIPNSRIFTIVLQTENETEARNVSRAAVGLANDVLSEKGFDCCLNTTVAFMD